MRKRSLLSLAVVAAFLVPPSLPPNAGAVSELVFKACVANGGARGCVDPPKDSLGDAAGVAVSPDGNSVYVASFSGSSVTAFMREPLTGALTYQGCIANFGANGCVDPPQDSLAGADNVAVSPDGKSVYVASRYGNSITHLIRDPATGSITYQGCIANAGVNGCIDPPQDPLIYASDVAVSPDGKSVYVASLQGNSVTHLIRDPSNGFISYQGCIANLGANGCIDPPQDALEGPLGVAVTPDGRSVYVSGYLSDSVVHLTRNTSTGLITYQGCVANGGANGCATPAHDSLRVPIDVAVSPDGKSVYVASFALGDDITHLTRDTSGGPTHGFIGFQGCTASGGAHGCVDPPHDSLDGAEAVAVSPDNERVYVASNFDNSVTDFVRDTSDGSISYLGCVANAGRDGCVDPPQDSLEWASNLVVSPDGRNVYVVATFDNSLTILDRVASGPGTTCAGKAAKIVGTVGRDKLRGTPQADVIAGLEGRDKISGLRGNDVLCGGPGKDKLKGGAGNDRLLGQGGADTLIGGPGKDKLKGGAGKDLVTQ